MNDPLDRQYLTWLYSQVGSVRLKNTQRTYWSLLRQLHTTEFVWFIPNDDNRVEDGRDLRYEFLNTNLIGHVDPEWLHLGCSMLEMLIGLSRRLSFEAEGEARYWFWKLIENLELHECNDALFLATHASEKIDDAVNRVIWRRYSRNGQGGLFPLERAREDQRRVEIWTQLNTYLVEQF